MDRRLGNNELTAAHWNPTTINNKLNELKKLVEVEKPTVSKMKKIESLNK